LTNRLDDESQGSLGIEYALDVWGRRKWLAILVFAAAFAAAVNVAMFLPDLYRATASVLVETQQISQEFVRSSVSAGVESRIQSIQQELMSRERLAGLVTRLNLYPDLRQKGVGLDTIIEQLRDDIRLEPTAVEQQMGGRGPMIGFSISYSGRDPQMVAQVANVLASSYVVANTRIREDQAMKTAEFLKGQLAEVKKELDLQEERVTDFNLGHIGELPQQIAASLSSLDRLNTQLRVNGENQVRLLDRRERLERQLTEMESAAPTPSSRAAVPSGAEQLAGLRQQLEELKRKFTDQYPEVVRVRAEIAALERQLSERGASLNAAAAATPAGASIDPKARLVQSVADANVELKALRAEELAFRQAIATYEQRVENMPKRQEEAQALSRDYDVTKERYETLLKKYEEAQLASSLEQGQNVEQFRILDTAVPPRDPSAPNRRRLVLVGFVLSIGFALCVVFLAEKLDTAFHNIDELRAFVGSPALFSIPVILRGADSRRQWRRVALVAVSIVVVTLIAAGSRYLASDNERLVRLTSSGRV
jgi:succinoglycan biosynthesis transport protein ExoP